MTVTMALTVLAALQVKHMLADFWWQNGWMLRHKGQWGHPGGITHAALHATLSAGLLLAFALPASKVLALVLAEAVVHYHIDWAKARLSRWRGHGPDDIGYWRAVGLDQLAHQATYLAMLAFLV